MISSKEQAEAYGIFFSCGESSCHQLENNSYYRWNIDNSNYNTNQFRIIFTKAFQLQSNDITRSDGCMAIKSGDLAKQFYQTFYDYYGQKIIPSSILQSDGTIVKAFLNGIKKANIDGVTGEFRISRENMLDVFGMMAMVQQEFEYNPCDDDDDMVVFSF